MRSPQLAAVLAAVSSTFFVAAPSYAGSFTEDFTAPPYTTNWFVIGNAGVPPPEGGCADHVCLTYTSDGLQWRADQSLTSDDLNTNLVLSGDVDVSFVFNHEGFGRTNVGLIATDGITALALAALDTDDTNYLNFIVPPNSTEYEHTGTPYMNRWTTIRIKVQGISVRFYAGVDGQRPVLLDTLYLSAPLGSYRLFLNVGSAPWKSGSNKTTFRSVTARFRGSIDRE